MMKKTLMLYPCIFFVFLSTKAQLQWQPGFQAHEYAQLLSLSFFKSSIADSNLRKTRQDVFRLYYQSPEVGLLNRWHLYLYQQSYAVINIRGTVNQTPSWLANFYAAMIPATGQLQLNDSTTFSYQLAADPKAMVHAGWTISLAHLAPDIIEKMKKVYAEHKINKFYIFGHSQGGAIAFLLRSYLGYLQQKGILPADWQFKTYCSAAPKPGNLFYAYDFDFMNRGGWAYTVVNAADWVPETPISIQTFKDFNETNPVVFAKNVLRKQKFPVRWVGNKMLISMERANRRAMQKQQKVLGKIVYRQVRKTLPQLQQPTYAAGNNYMRAGTPVILMPDADYFQKYPSKSENLFLHHLFAPYYYLLEKNYMQP